MAVSRTSFAWASWALAAALVSSAASAEPSPRILGSSVGIEPKAFQARVRVGNDPSEQVARVVFTMTPRCSADPSTASYGSIPEVVATAAKPEDGSRIFEATIPDPSNGAYGSWAIRSTAYDGKGGIIGRHQTLVVRRFEPKFRTLAFQVPGGGKTPGTLDTSAGPATAQLVVDLDHDAAISSLALITTAHDNPSIGFSPVPKEVVQDRAAGATPWLTSRLTSTATTTMTGQFEFPAASPPMTLGIQRMYLVDAHCRTAELAPPSPLTLKVTSATPRALPMDVRLDTAALGRGQLIVAFRLVGPAARKAPAPEIGGTPAPVVTVNLLDHGTPAQVLGTTVARPVADGAKWDGESMAIPPITIPSGPTALGEALKKGLVVEIDDGGKGPAVRATLPAR